MPTTTPEPESLVETAQEGNGSTATVSAVEDGRGIGGVPTHP